MTVQEKTLIHPGTWRRDLIDLHTHSTASDGTDSPETLVRKAAACGLVAIALTDHETLEGIPAALQTAQSLPIEVIPGCELAVQGVDDELHLIALWMPGTPSSSMRKVLQAALAHRRIRNISIVERLCRLGLDITLDEVLAKATGEPVGRPHIAAVLLQKGYVRTHQEAFIRYIGLGGQAYTPRSLISPEEGLALLKAEGATVALAHPCLNKRMTPTVLDNLLVRLKHCGLDALEVYHSSHTQQDIRVCTALAAKHTLLPTGGSDYHGKTKPGIVLGIGAGSLRVPAVLLAALKLHRQEKGLLV